MDSPAGFLTVRELAELIGAREPIILWWQTTGDGPAHEQVYGRTLYRAEAVDDWLAHDGGRVVARLSNSISNSTSLVDSRVFADAPAAA